MTVSSWRLALLLLAVLSVQACTVIPGSHVSTRGMERAETEEDDTLLPADVRVQPIGTGVLNSSKEEESSPIPEALRSEDSYDYHIGVGDVLHVTVWDHPELTIPAGSERSAEDSGNWVHSDGTIFYPYIGRVTVEGKTVREVQEIVEERLGEYIESPQVDVTIAAFRSQKVYVTGAVRQPGTFPITNVPMDLVAAINEAGGLDENAGWREVQLTRGGREYRLSLRDIYEGRNVDHNVRLKPGDVVHLPRVEDNKVYVLGEVNEARSVPMTRNGLTLVDALSEAGGFNETRANATGIFVLRRAPEDDDHLIDVFQLNAKSATALVLADNFHLQSGDVVYTTAVAAARWNRVIDNILPSLRTIVFAQQVGE